MANFINENFRGVKVTIAITGLPCTITGEVVTSPESDIVVLRLEGGNKVYINGALIAFVY